MQRRILLASKRAPVEYSSDSETGEISVSVSPGGTASVIADQASYLDVSWVASAMTKEDVEIARANPDGFELALGPGKPIRLHLLEHDVEVFNPVQYYFANEVLWLTHHSLWDSWRVPTFDAKTRHAWECYLKFNSDFATALYSRAGNVESPTFLIHDFQLLSVPQFLRESLPKSRILSFSHSAWPPADVWRFMPKYIRRPMIETMLHADVIGFFAKRWVRNLLDCVEDTVPEAVIDRAANVVRREGHTTLVGAFPLGYSPQLLETRRPKLPEALMDWIGAQPLIVHSGRTDPIKNAPRATKAFRAAVEQVPAMANALFAIKMNPNRLYVQVNQEYLEETESSVQEVNKALGREAARLIVDNDVHLTLGLFQRADVLFLNSVVDGMNLSAFEGTMVNDRSVQLILSETCGAAEVLAGVCNIVSPFDLEEQVQSLTQAFLASDADRKQRYARLRDTASRYTLVRWVDTQIQSLGL